MLLSLAMGIPAPPDAFDAHRSVAYSSRPCPLSPMPALREAGLAFRSSRNVQFEERIPLILKHVPDAVAGQRASKDARKRAW